MYDFDEVGYKDELIRFWSQKVKGQGHSKTTWSNKHPGRHSLTCLRNKWTHFNEPYHNYSLAYMTLQVAFSRSWSPTTFSEMHFPDGGIYRSTVHWRILYL